MAAALGEQYASLARVQVKKKEVECDQLEPINLSNWLSSLGMLSPVVTGDSRVYRGYETHGVSFFKPVIFWVTSRCLHLS